MAEQTSQDRQSTAKPPPLPAIYTRAPRKTRVGEVVSSSMNKTIVVRTITRRDATELIAGLRAAHFGVTTLDAEGATGPVQMIFTVVRRRELDIVSKTA